MTPEQKTETFNMAPREIPSSVGQTAMIDKQRLATRFARAANSYNHEATAQLQIAERLCQLLTEHLTTPITQAIEVGCGTGLFTEFLLTHLQPQTLWLNDLVMQPALHLITEPCHVEADAAPSAPLTAAMHTAKITFVQGDAERIPFPTGQQLIASCSAVHWFTDLPQFLRKCHEALAPGGCLAIATYGQENLCEVRAHTGVGLTYFSLPQLRQMLADQHFTLATAFTDQVTLRLPNALAVLQHLRRTGVTALASTPWTKGRLQAFATAYSQAHPHPLGGVKLTYQPIYIIAFKK